MKEYATKITGSLGQRIWGCFLATIVFAGALVVGVHIIITIANWGYKFFGWFK